MNDKQKAYQLAMTEARSRYRRTTNKDHKVKTFTEGAMWMLDFLSSLAEQKKDGNVQDR